MARTANPHKSSRRRNFLAACAGIGWTDIILLPSLRIAFSASATTLDHPIKPSGRSPVNEKLPDRTRMGGRRQLVPPAERVAVRHALHHAPVIVGRQSNS